MKRTTIAVLSAALLLGGTLSSPAVQAASPSEAGQSAVSSDFKLNPAIKKEYGGAVFELESLTATPQSTEYLISRNIPQTLDPEMDRNMMAMNYFVMDSNGWIYDRIQAEDKGREKPDGTFDRYYKEKLGALKGKPKELIIKPYIGGNYDDKSTKFAEKASVTAKLSDKYPVKLDQGKIGTVNVTGVEFEKDRTVLTLAIEGETASIQNVGTWLVENGKTLDHTRKELISVKDGVYRYELEFPAVDRKAPLQVKTKRMTPVTFLKELEMRVKLPQ
ncbi:DUF5643 domain-containing protein [Paenibacillus sp. DMB20]|uniref:DUF5643 domain-containing protein n=1 Tax=Paenibacillus sp. DMB20 TaxID=1642570 RepID=UPI000627C827|nr:DUF5643 domain-containing protein [Paenibacillus sp. DMB20]KKO53012.1 hypothetical protein XI25_16565 [Paenibacillus sp. DMB20]KKO53791.1 hypothetical protein XI25_12585 [Paenibacillus sp. DMB20]